MILAHINSDPHLDIVSANTASDDVSVMLGDGLGGFEPQRRFTIPVESEYPRWVAADDLDGDGFLDLVTANDITLDVSVMMGNGQGTFDNGSSRTLNIGFNTHSVLLEDVDGDGHTDVLANTATPTDTDLALFLNDGQGNFPQEPLRMGIGSTRIRAIQLGDMDGDGHRDIVGAIKERGCVGILRGDGQGGFAEATIHRPGNCSGMLLGDMDEDGQLDVLTVGLGDKLLLLTNLNTLRSEGTRLVRGPLPPCGPDRQTGVSTGGDKAASLAFRPESPCRVDRLELRVQNPVEHIDLITPFGITHRATPPTPISGVWRPERVPSLSRLESIPAAGRWSLESNSAFGEVEVLINTYPQTPSSPRPPPRFAAQTATNRRIPTTSAD